MRIRPMLAQDAGAADAVAWEAIGSLEGAPGERPAWHAQAGPARLAHLAETDPPGAWVAEQGGRVVGVAVAIVRDGTWGLSLLAVGEAARGGTGARLLEAALAHRADDARGGLIVSSSHPAALRLYAQAGFSLHPRMAAAGTVERSRLRAATGVSEAGEDALEALTSLGRATRGAAYAAEDLAIYLQHGARLLRCGDRGFAIHRDGEPLVLAALDADAGRALLRAVLAEADGSTRVPISAGQDWAVQVALETRLTLAPEGPLFARGAAGPRGLPWIPSGAFL